MKLFEFNKDLTSYTYPIIKIITTTVLLGIIVARDQIAFLVGLRINTIPSIALLIIVIPCIYCLIISICELLNMYWNRREGIINTDWLTELSLCDISQALCDSDVTQIKVLEGNIIIKMGTSSTYRHYADNKPIETHYYLGNCKFRTIEQFQDAFMKEFPTGVVTAVSIDDISPRDTIYGMSK